MAHPHSAGWSSGDWHRPIINLPFHWCPLGFSSFLNFIFIFIFSYFLFFILLILTSVLLIFKLFIYFSSFSSFLFFSFLLSHLLFFNLCLFSLTRRYIDDLITINNPRFDGAIGKIYPSALTLKETNLSDHRVAYLDRQLEIKKGKLVMSLYDKRDDSP